MNGVEWWWMMMNDDECQFACMCFGNSGVLRDCDSSRLLDPWPWPGLAIEQHLDSSQRRSYRSGSWHRRDVIWWCKNLTSLTAKKDECKKSAGKKGSYFFENPCFLSGLNGQSWNSRIWAHCLLEVLAFDIFWLATAHKIWSYLVARVFLLDTSVYSYIHIYIYTV
jgi:hypothetical protein